MCKQAGQGGSQSPRVSSSKTNKQDPQMPVVHKAFIRFQNLAFVLDNNHNESNIILSLSRYLFQSLLPKNKNKKKNKGGGFKKDILQCSSP